MSNKKTRPSPSEHAGDFPNEIKKGNDGLIYLSMRDKNSVYKWQQINDKDIDIKLLQEKPKKNSYIVNDTGEYIYYAEEDINGKYYWKKKLVQLKKSPIEYYKQFPDYVEPKHDIDFFIKTVPKLEKEFKKIGVDFCLIKWNRNSPSPFEYEYWSEDDFNEKNYIYVSEKSLYFSSIGNGTIYLNHFIESKMIDAVNIVLHKYFPNRTRGLINDLESIEIFSYDKKNLSKATEKIQVLVNISFIDKKLTERSYKYIKIIKKQLSVKIGYLSSYDEMILNGYLNLDFIVRKDKIDDFKKIFNEIKENKLYPDVPKIKDIKLIM